jgi:pimeloyl-ACP methyl ester carboxylesterase
VPFVNSFDGTPIFCLDCGTGPAVVFLPGINLSHEVWNREVAELVSSHRLLTLDLRGHGASGKPAGDHSYETHARDVDALLTARGVERAVLVGWSFGGAVALRYAASYPERVAGLVLVGAAAPRYTAAPDWPDGVPIDVARARLTEEVTARPRFRRAILDSAFHGSTPTETLDWLWGLSMKTPTWSSLACRDALLTDDLRPALGDVRAPTLIVHGRHDVHVPFGSAEAVHAGIAQSVLVPFEESGHAPHLEESDKFQRTLHTFLREPGVAPPVHLSVTSHRHPQKESA